MFETLEEAQEEILRLQGELDAANVDKENYANQVNELTKTVEKVREINQKYFLKLSAFHDPQAPNGNEAADDVPTCEEFAKTLL